MSDAADSARDSEILRLILTTADYVDVPGDWMRIDSAYDLTPEQAARIRAIIASQA